jgi:hypothetical protein
VIYHDIDDNVLVLPLFSTCQVIAQSFRNANPLELPYYCSRAIVQKPKMIPSVSSPKALYNQSKDKPVIDSPYRLFNSRSLLVAEYKTTLDEWDKAQRRASLSQG